MKAFFFQPRFEPDFIYNKIAEKNPDYLDIKTISFLHSQKHMYLPEKFEEDTPDLLFVPASFDISNCANYDGVEFAMQWYFNLTNKKINFSIVLLGIEEKSSFFMNCEYSQFLKCPNVFYINYNYFEITNFVKNYILKEYSSEEYINSIKKIGLSPPKSYKSHHSITNEWCINRWSKFLGVNMNLQKQLDSQIRGSLYYNYLQAINPIETISEPKNYKIKGSGKILLVDDEVDKGWDEFFKSLISDRNFKSIGQDFKKQSTEEIIKSSISNVKLFNPDLVILDLRLHDDDFETKEAKELTGMKILNEIKKYNKGIQVLAFTASDKVWNYIKLQEKGIDGYILKESPEYSQNNTHTNNTILSIIKNIEERILIAIQLKQISLNFTDIKNFVDVYNGLNSEFKNSTTYNTDISYDLLYKSFEPEKQKYMNFAYLQLFILLEEFLKQEDVFEEGDNCYVIHKQNRYLTLQLEKTIKREKEYISAIEMQNGHYHIKKSNYKKRFIDTNYKMSAVLLFKYGCATSGEKDWTKIYNTRNNKAAHPESEKIEFDEFKKLVNLLLYVFDEKNFNPVSIDQALPTPSFEEQIKRLKEKHEGI